MGIIKHKEMNNITTLLPSKPRMGEPCTGCGTCCASEVCKIGKAMFPEAEPPCPGLVYKDNRLWCKLVLTENLTDIERKVIKLSLGIGCCCDSSDIT